MDTIVLQVPDLREGEAMSPPDKNTVWKVVKYIIRDGKQLIVLEEVNNG
jgi:hypothetical protein